MPIRYGFDTFIEIGEESTFGQAQTGTTQQVRVSSANLIARQEKIRKSELTTSSSGMQAGTFQGFKIVGGTIDVPMYYDGIGQLLKSALGSVATGAQDGNGNYPHVYTPSFSLPSNTIQLQRGKGLSNGKEIFKGCKVSRAQFSAEAGRELIASFDIIGADADPRSGDITKNLPSFDKVLANEGSAITQGGTLSAGSVGVESMNITIDNKLERKQEIGTKLATEAPIGDLREVTMTVTCDVTDNDVYADSLTDNNGDVTVTFTRQADPNHFVKFTLSDAEVEEYDDPPNAFGRTKRTWTFRGHAKAGDGFKIEVTNASASGETVAP